jgi:hypothetical protein
MPPKINWNGFLKAGLLAALMLPAGCGSVSAPLQSVSHPFGPSAHDEAIRKQAEADSFPDAKHAEL